MQTVTRRDLIKSASVGTVALGALGLGTVTANAEEVVEDTGASYTQIAGTNYSNASWRVKPEQIADDQIAQTYECDVVVVGLGHGGGAAAVELSEQGYAVIGLEKQLEDSFRTTGNDMGHINSELSNSLGGGSGYDVVEFYTNWMLNCTNAANPALVMKYARNGETIDWWYEKAAGDAEARLVFEPANDERPNIQTEVGPFKFYCTSINFNDTYSILNSKAAVEAANENSHFLFGYAGCQLVQDDSGAVTGVVAQNVETEEYIRVNASAVVLATGGFGGDSEMATDLLIDLQYALQANDQECFNMMGMDRTGDGVKMAYWAGARMEINPATMDGRASWQTSSPALVPMLAHPQGIHLDYTGRRFYNEFWGPIETRSRPLMSRNREIFYAFYDSNLTEYMQYVPASHGTTDPTAETLEGVQAVLDAAYAAGSEGYYDEASQSTWYGADTVEELVAMLGVEEKVAANMVAAVESWNACVAAGADTEFGRDANYLFPIEAAPFYANVNENNVLMGNFLVTLGGVCVDGDQRILGEDWKPIANLFGTGNVTGGRFGWDYFSPAYGVSVGMAIILGRECGKSVAQYLAGELV